MLVYDYLDGTSGIKIKRIKDEKSFNDSRN
jgi:hypothetical protein